VIEERALSTDPRAANCRAFAISTDGLITGVDLDYLEQPATPYQLVRVELIDEAANGVGGPTVATCTVLDGDGLAVGARVYLAWPWPNLTNDADHRGLPGNPNGQHTIVNKCYPPLIGPLALYVGDSNGQPISDIIGGLGLPLGHHVSYRATWRARNTTPEPTPVESPALVAALAAGFDRLSAALDRLQAAVNALAQPQPRPVPLPTPTPLPEPEPTPAPEPPPTPARTVTAFSQRDARWAGQTLGTGAPSIGQAGCLLSAVASALCDMGISTDPGRLNAWLTAFNGYYAGNELVWAKLAGLGVQTVELIECPDPFPAPVDKLRAYLEQGAAVVIEIDAQPGVSGLQQHWLRLLSVDADGKDADVVDPWQMPGQERQRLSLYGKPGWDVARVILGAGVLGRRG
jgi:hypothetical protein